MAIKPHPKTRTIFIMGRRLGPYVAKRLHGDLKEFTTKNANLVHVVANTIWLGVLGEDELEPKPKVVDAAERALEEALKDSSLGKDSEVYSFALCRIETDISEVASEHLLRLVG